MSNLCLLDSNILLRLSNRQTSHYGTIRIALEALARQNLQFCFTSQTLGEFWNASTRPLERNGFGLSVREADEVAHVIERDFRFLPDSLDVHTRWRALLVSDEIKGVKVHDARVAASMYVHSVSLLLTLNVRDFLHFSDIHVIHPDEAGTWQH